ncbi:hypothetical protein ABZP36_014580 [Zizania latifolia]
MDHGGGVWIRAAVAVAAGGAIAARAVRRKSVDSAVFVGVPAMVAHTVAGYRFAGMLLVFFFTASRVTRVGETRKRALDPEFKEGGHRNWKQVLSNSGIASILVVLIALVTGGNDRCLDMEESSLVTALIGGVIGHHACCNAAAAGFSIGLTFVLLGLLTTHCASDVFWKQLLVIPLATAAGLCGSLIDSLLGATLQYSGYCSVRKKVVGVDSPTVTRISGLNILDNNGVNVVSVFLTTLITALGHS